MDKKIIKFTTKIMGMLLVIFVGLSLIFYDYSSDVKNVISGNLITTVNQGITTSIDSLNKEMTYIKKVIINSEDKLSSYLDDEELMKVNMQNIITTSNISLIYHVNNLGVGYNQNGEMVRVGNQLIASSKDEIMVGEKLSNINGTHYITLSTRIKDNSYLIFLVNIQVLENVLYDMSYNSKGFTALLDNNGNMIVSKGKNSEYGSLDNILLNMNESDREKNRIILEIKNNITAGTKGEVNVNLFNEKVLLNYAPTNINNWYFISSMPLSSIELKSAELTTISFTLLLKVVVIIIVLWVYFYVTQKREEQKLKLSEETYKIVVDQVDCIIFQHNYITGEITHSDKYYELFNENYIKNNFPYSYIKEGVIHEDDGIELVKYFNNTKLHNGLEVRIRNAFSEYIWCKIKMETVYDGFKKQLKLVGSIQNINDQKLKEFELIKKSMRDSLTSLYNKGATELLITNYLSNYGNDNVNAFIIVDLDNFKNINDTRGHQYGDKILTNLSACLKREFNTSSIIGRIGGDEFVVFIKDVGSLEYVNELGERICNIFRLDVEPDGSVSGSVGIAVSPQSGNNFSELYRNADVALYDAKRMGKDRYSIYKK